MTTIFHRQGDVGLLQVPELPTQCEELATENGRIILAYGEVTGHHHSVDAVCAQLLGTGEEQFLRVTQATQLEHQEHAPIGLAPGIYRVLRQREYHPVAIRNVAD
jgi:hypothetical protein